MTAMPESPATPPVARKSHSGPDGHWLWGCLRQLQRDPLNFYTRTNREFGHYVRIRAFPGIYLYLLTHPEAVEHVLQKHHKNYRKPDFFNKTVGLLAGNGILTSEGDFWLRQRRLIQPAFHRPHLAKLIPLMVAAAESFIQERESAGLGQPIDMLDRMMKLGLRIAGTTLFGTDVATEADDIGRAYRTGFEYISYRMNSPPLIPAWLPTPRNLAFARAKKLLDRVVLELIAARRRDKTARGVVSPPQSRMSLAVLLEIMGQVCRLGVLASFLGAAMAKRGYQRRFIDRIEDRDPNVMWMKCGEAYVVAHGHRYAAVGDRLTVIRDADILLQTHIVSLGQRVHHGQIVAATTPSWLALRKEVLADPSLMEHFPAWHREFEEFVAGGYLASQWSDVILSPRAHDGGFDIAARKRGRQILDEAKAYKSSLPVDHQIVRAALGLLIEHKNVDQVRVTTTSRFAPMVLPDFDHLIPDKLALRDQRQLLRWLRSIGNRSN